jgi:hypothetical protein
MLEKPQNQIGKEMVSSNRLMPPAFFPSKQFPEVAGLSKEILVIVSAVPTETEILFVKLWKHVTQWLQLLRLHTRKQTINLIGYHFNQPFFSSGKIR